MSNINYFPGHIKKTYNQLDVYLKQSDLIIYMLDARIPFYCFNDYITSKLKNKKILILFNKYLYSEHKKVNDFCKVHSDLPYLKTDINDPNSIKLVKAKIVELAQDLIANQLKRKIVNPSITCLVIGVPNVGKSSIINRLSHNHKAITRNLPGTTRTITRFAIDEMITIIDTPGVLWPKFDTNIAEALICVGSVKERENSVEDSILYLLDILTTKYSQKFMEKYQLQTLDNVDQILNDIGRNTGCLTKNNEVDLTRVYSLLLKDIRNGNIKNVDLER
jgi:ribosome biogenesis GTPase A